MTGLPRPYKLKIEMKKRRAILVGLIFIGGLVFAGNHTSAGEGWLGIYTQELSKPTMIALGVKYGLLVTRVIEDSPAEHGGIKEGDVLLEVNNEKLRDYHDLKSIIEDNPNKEVEIKLQRAGEIKTLKLKLGERKEKRKKFGTKWEFWYPEGKKRIGPFEIYPFDKKEIDELKRELKELRENLRRLFKELKKEYKEIPREQEEEFDEELFKEPIPPELPQKI